MLKRIQLRLAYHAQAAKSSVRLLKSRPLTTLMTVVVIAMTLTLPALFWVFTDNLHRVSGDWQRGGHISLYLDSTISADEEALLERVRATPGVGEASLRTPAEGLAEMQQQDGMHDIMQYLPENPLPAVIDVLPSVDVNTAEKSSELYQVLKAYPHVEQARYDVQWISRLYTLLDVATKVARVMLILLAATVVLIIGNTLRMAIHHRQEEIQVLTFIGAGRPYIIRPFLYLGVFYGVAGAAMAMMIVYVVMLCLASQINVLIETYEMHYAFAGLSFEDGLFLLLSAMALGWLAARLSVSGLCRAQN